MNIGGRDVSDEATLKDVCARALMSKSWRGTSSKAKATSWVRAQYSPDKIPQWVGDFETHDVYRDYRIVLVWHCLMKGAVTCP